MRVPRHPARVVVILAWLMFIFSFFLPATDVVEMGGTAPGTPLTGWHAFTTSFQMFGHPLTFLLIPKEPRLLLLLAFPLINLVMLLSPLPALAWDQAWLVRGVFLFFGFVPWLLPKEVTGNLFAGFYLWDLSFFLMCAGCILASITWKQAYEAEIQRLHQSTA